MQGSSDYILSNSKEYAIYCCSSRGIPYVGDGLKSGQRMALWLLRNKSEKIKTYALTGLMGAMGLFLHGEKSANDAIGLLAAPYKNNYCLIEGLGQFGSKLMPSDDGIGAPRYTEVRRSKAAETFLYQDLDLIPLEDNHDGSNQQPKYFLPIIPVVLLNGISGVAVGWSTDILPRSFRSIVDATKLALLEKPIPLIEPFHARYNISVKATGKPNQWEYTGHADIVDSSTIKVTEIPPGMAIESFRKRLIDMEDQDEIVGFTDRSTENIDITIKMKRGSVKDWKEQDAIDFFKIKEKTTERIVVIDWHGTAIRTYNTAEQLIVDFAMWRLGWYSKRYEKLLADNSYEINYWYALRMLFEKKFPEKLGTFVDKTEIEQKILFITKAIDDTQLEKIINLPTYRWTNEFFMTVNKKILEIEQIIANCKTILASPQKLRDIYLSELDNLKSFKG